MPLVKHVYEAEYEAELFCLLQLKTNAKQKEQVLADLEKQHASLSAQIEESKRGKEDSVSDPQHLVFPLPLGCMPYNGPVMYTQ